MKLNLGCGADIRSGYVNVDRLPPNNAPTELYRQGDIKSLDWLTEDAQVQEIIAMDCLEYLPSSVIQSAITNWHQKLVPNGILKITVPDCHAVAKSFAQGQLNLQEFSTIMFGTENDNDKRLSAIDGMTLLDMLCNIGFTIILKRYDGISIYLEATKC